MQQQQEPQILASAKRPCMEQSNVLEDLEGDSIEVDCGVISVASDGEDFAEESVRQTSTTSPVATSGERYRGGNFPGKYANRVDSAVLTAREALSTTEPAEPEKQSLQDRVQPSQKKMHPTSTANLCRYPTSASSSNHDSHLNKISSASASPSHNSTSSSPILAIDEQPHYRHALQSDAADQFGEERPSPSDSYMGLESRYTSPSFEEPEFLGFSKPLADQPRVPTKDQNSSKAIENCQLAFDTSSNQSCTTSEVQGYSSLPSRGTFQDQSLVPTRPVASLSPVSPSTHGINDRPPASPSASNNQRLLSDTSQIRIIPYDPVPSRPARGPPCSSQRPIDPPITKEQKKSARLPPPCPQSRPPPSCSIPELAQPPLSNISQSQPCAAYTPPASYQNRDPLFPQLPSASAQDLGYLSIPPVPPKHQDPAPQPVQPSPAQLELHASSRPPFYEVLPLGSPPAQSACGQGPLLPPPSPNPSAQWHSQPHADSSMELQGIQRSLQHLQHVPSLGQEQFSPSPRDSSQFAGQRPPHLPLTTQSESVSLPPDLSSSAYGVTSPNSTPSPGHQQPLETKALLWKKYNEMVTLNVLVDTQPNLDLNNSRPGHWKTIFASSLWMPTLEEFFQSVSVALGTAPPTTLFIDFWNVHSQFERRMIIPRGDSNSFTAMRIVAWEYFKEIMNLDPAAANIKIYIIPSYSTVSGSANEYTPHQSQQMHGFNTTPNIPSDQQSFVTLPNRNDSSIEPSSAIDQDRSKPRGPPQIGPPPNAHSDTNPSRGPSRGPPRINLPPESQSNLSRVSTSESTNFHGYSSNPAVESIPDLNNRNRPESNILEPNNNLGDAGVTSIQNSQRQSRQQASQLHNPKGTKIDNNNGPTAKIVIRIQIDGLGRLSRSYDRSVLSTRITNEKFFAWFEQQTGRAYPPKLRFNFKDAPFAKPSTIERGNEDYFELMVKDIKKKFERAKVYTPDMNEFCIVVTDPMWDSGDEDEDEDDEDEDG
jgi:hypothetical protein